MGKGRRIMGWQMEDEGEWWHPTLGMIRCGPGPRGGAGRRWYWYPTVCAGLPDAEGMNGCEGSAETLRDCIAVAMLRQPAPTEEVEK